MSIHPNDMAHFDKARAEDEGFWCQQEASIQGAIGQPCCTLSGLTTGFKDLEGNFAVVVHGEVECLSSFQHSGRSTFKFFCTGLQDEHFTLGQTAKRLQKLLRLVATDLKPEAIFILGTCPVEVIGDRFEEAVIPIAAEFPDIQMVPLHTSGLKLGTQAHMLDWLFTTLAHVPPKAPENAPDPERCLNFLGLPEHRSPIEDPGYTEMLNALGLHLVSAYPYRCSLDDWRAVSHAKTTFTIDDTLYPGLVSRLRDGGQQVVNVPLPVGIDNTRAFYDIIAKHFDVEDKVDALFQRQLGNLEAEMADFRSRHQGKRLAFGLRMLNNYATDQLAFAGMADYAFFEELGFDITLLVQGAPERAKEFRALLDEQGISHEIEVFPEPWTISTHLGPNRFDLAYLANHCRAQADIAKVPMIISRSFRPWLSGVSRNIRSIEQALRRTF